MRYGSVCSGIEAATVAWHPLGWSPSFFSEIDPNPRTVLAHHYPDVPLHGDFTTIQAGDYEPIDLLVGGTPCQSFSVAGLRGGLADDRGNLALEYLLLAKRLRPRWLVWENVPGVLSSAGGRDFGSILGGLVELGYGFAYRVLDAQFVRVDGFGRAVPQRRRRVFVVGYLGDWRRAAAVLFERQSLRGDPAPRRQAGEGIAGTLEASLGRSRGAGTPPGALTPQIANPLGAKADGGWRGDFDHDTFVPVVSSLLSGGHSNNPLDENLVAFDTTQITSPTNRNNPQPGDPCHPLAAGAHPPAIAFSCKDNGRDATTGAAPTLRSMGHSDSHQNGGGQLAVAFDARQSDVIQYGDITGPLDTDGHTMAVHRGWAVRRLLPVECEALQGFPRNYTLVPTKRGVMADGPRYKMLGNSFAVNVVRWLGRRIEAVEALTTTRILEAAE